MTMKTRCRGATSERQGEIRDAGKGSAIGMKEAWAVSVLRFAFYVLFFCVIVILSDAACQNMTAKKKKKEKKKKR